MLMADDLEESRQRVTYEAAIYREQLTMLRREMERISLTTLDLANAASAVEALKSKDILVPVGGGTYVKAKISSTEVLVPIGAEFVVETDRESAMAELKRRSEATRQAVTRLNDEFEKINRKLRQTMSALQGIESQAAISRRVDEGIKEDYI
jgi:prefoldin alpha subunit